MASKFFIAPKSIWRLSDIATDGDRDLALSDSSFSEIANLVSDRAAVEKCKWNHLSGVSAFSRIVVTFRLQPNLVSMFHSSRGGYRAQYYKSISLGQYANRHILSVLEPLIVDSLASNTRYSSDLIVQSLRHREAKIWIHQGSWLRYRRVSERLIQIQRWATKINTGSDRERRLAVWAILSPRKESLLEVKGGYISGKTDYEKIIKPQRAEEIHSCGFT